MRACGGCGKMVDDTGTAVRDLDGYLHACLLANGRDCRHGQLARSCELCQLEKTVAEQAAEITQLIQERRRWLAVFKRAASYLDCTLAGRNSTARAQIADVLRGAEDSSHT